MKIALLYVSATYEGAGTKSRRLQAIGHLCWTSNTCLQLLILYPDYLRHLEVLSQTDPNHRRITAHNTIGYTSYISIMETANFTTRPSTDSTNGYSTSHKPSKSTEETVTGDANNLNAAHPDHGGHGQLDTGSRTLLKLKSDISKSTSKTRQRERERYGRKLFESEETSGDNITQVTASEQPWVYSIAQDEIFRANVSDNVVHAILLLSFIEAMSEGERLEASARSRLPPRSEGETVNPGPHAKGESGHAIPVMFLGPADPSNAGGGLLVGKHLQPFFKVRV